MSARPQRQLTLFESENLLVVLRQDGHILVRGDFELMVGRPEAKTNRLAREALELKMAKGYLEPLPFLESITPNARPETLDIRWLAWAFLKPARLMDLCNHYKISIELFK